MAVVPAGTSNGSITKLPVCALVNVPVMTFVGLGAPHDAGATAPAGAANASTTNAPITAEAPFMGTSLGAADVLRAIQGRPMSCGRAIGLMGR